MLSRFFLRGPSVRGHDDVLFLTVFVGPFPRPLMLGRVPCCWVSIPSVRLSLLRFLFLCGGEPDTYFCLEELLSLRCVRTRQCIGVSL